MTDSTKQDQKKTLSLGKGTLELKGAKPAARTEGAAGSVRQSFSHGRSKTVAVEVKKRRAGDRAPEAAEAAQPVEKTRSKGGVRVVTSTSARGLTSEEKEARVRALRGAPREDDSNAGYTEETGDTETGSVGEDISGSAPVAGISPTRSGPLSAEDLRRREMEELRQIREDEKASAEASQRRHSEQEAHRRKPAGGSDSIRQGRAGGSASGMRAAAIDAPSAAPGRGRPGDHPAPPGMEEEEGSSRRSRRGGGGGRAAPGRAPAQPETRPRGDDKRRSGKISVSQVTGDEDGDAGIGRPRVRSMASMRRAREREKRQAGATQEPVKVSRDVTIPEFLTVQELANRMAERGADVIKILMRMGMMATINQNIDADTAELIVTELGHKPKRVSEFDVELGLKGSADTAENLTPRAPVVTVMGHVDHGKTSLLDALRHTDMVSGEAGGITQHIGAYQVTLASGAKITFIDTPGHEAFTEMRARGANVTDVVVLVVAADDGIKPQTVEAINHAKAAKVPIVVAINKIDLPAANPNRVRQELLQHELVVEEMGGDILAVEVSAKGRRGLEKLEEAILLQAEILDLKANPDRSAEGVIVEARMERGRGSVATVLVRRGTLRVGDIFVAGSEWGRVRAMVTDKGASVEEATPSMPVEVLGANGTPLAGDELVVVENEAKAREVAEFRQRKKREAATVASARGSMEQMFQQIKAGNVKELPVVIKGDVQGSVEAISTALEKLAPEGSEVRVRVLQSSVGAINESDVTLANASKAAIIGFNVRANPQAREMARRDGIDIRYYSIIYNILDDIKGLLSGMLAPTLREKFLGYAEIREVFNITKVGKVAGCMVTEGVVKRGAGVRLLRDNVVIHEGKLKTLKRFKDEVKEVRDGFECGMAFENYDDIRQGDMIECFEVEQIARTL
ncbi:MAG: translation initiation factor IF-2 [Pseudomonadota bacterium]|nr:translation initiation factor IF-2 [Pseudomonadota bacterium]